MLDQQHGHPLHVAHAADLTLQRMNLFVVEAGGWLIQQQQLGFGGQRAGKFDAFADRERQIRPLHGMGEGAVRFMNCDQLHRLFAHGRFFPPEPRAAAAHFRRSQPLVRL